MALEGTIKDFGLPDIFQLIGLQRKTGLLTLKHEQDQVTVFFENGQVVNADSASKRLEDRLGNVLVKQGKLTPQRLEEALSTQRQTLQRLGHVLTAQSYITPDDLKAAINVQIKSGTNEVHGSAFWFHNDNKTKAKPFFSPAGSQNPKNVFNQFGGTVGGPIVKNKLFYFASWEQNTDRQFASSIRSIPTVAMRNGDMSATNRIMYDPQTGGTNGVGRQAFPNIVIPADRIDRSVALQEVLVRSARQAGPVFGA